MKKLFKMVILGVTVTISLAAGLIEFSAFADQSSSAFIYADKEHTIIADMKAPEYKVNENGETYGSALYARTPSEEPDLISAVGDDGTIGYIKRTDADGEMPSSPEEALKMQEEREKQYPRTIPLYAEDGVTVIGTFTIGLNSEYFQVYSDDTLAYDNTPDSYPLAADNEIVYEDIIDEPITEFDSDISDTDVSYDYDYLVGYSEGVPNPQTGVAVPYTAVALAWLSSIYLAGVIRKRDR